MYKTRKEALSLLEQQAALGNIDLYYGDATKISQEGYVPYGWQFADEEIGIEATKGKSINCFVLAQAHWHYVYSPDKDKYGRWRVLYS